MQWEYGNSLIRRNITPQIEVTPDKEEDGNCIVKFNQNLDIPFIKTDSKLAHTFSTNTTQIGNCWMNFIPTVSIPASILWNNISLFKSI